MTDRIHFIFGTFSNLTILFMMISGFCLCAGYLNKFCENTIDIERFYIKRFFRILPFFLPLLFIALIVEPTKEHLADFLLEATLLHGFLPADNTIDIMGVSWFLGVIFIFYITFPFFTVLLKKKKKHSYP